MENEKILICENCGAVISEAKATTIETEDGEKTVCDECLISYFYCEKCEQWHLSDKTESYTISTDHGYETWCEDCMSENAVICDDCEELTDVDYTQKIYVHGEWKTICNDCIDNYIQCERCGDWVVSGEEIEVITSERGYIELWCDDCTDYHSFICDNCGERYIDELQNFYDGEYYCPACYENAPENVLEEYRVTQAEHFYNVTGEISTGLYMGVELEVDRRVSNNSAIAEAVAGIRENHDYFFSCKHDGSLDYGFEIVSQPASLPYHTADGNPWKVAIKQCIDNGFVSHDSGNCGLHVHVNRDFFGDYDTECVMRLWAIFNNNREWLRKFARRDSDRWASFKSSETIEKKELLKDIVEYEKGLGHTMERYQAINNTNSQTIEFRLFKGTLKESTLYATLSFVNWVCHYVVSHDDFDCEALNLSNVELPEAVVSYCHERNINVLV